MIFIILFGLLFVGVIAFMIFYTIKRRNAVWSGTVIDKQMVETSRDSMSDSSSIRVGSVSFGSQNAMDRNYSLRIKDDTGKEFNWSVGQGVYESVNVGDKLVKNKGTETPTKVQ